MHTWLLRPLLSSSLRPESCSRGQDTLPQSQVCPIHYFWQLQVSNIALLELVLPPEPDQHSSRESRQYRKKSTLLMWLAKQNA